MMKSDLVHLVGNKIHFDEYDSKMGENQDVITASFKVKQRMPAQDLVSFIENGYDWVLDADVSSGEVNDGEFLVFVEMPRHSKIYDQLVEMLEDLEHLTDHKINDWQFKWYKQKNYSPLSREAITEMVPDTPSRYKEFISDYDQVNEAQEEIKGELDRIKKLSGI